MPAAVKVNNYALDPAEIAFFTSAGIDDLTRFLVDWLGVRYHDSTIQDYYFDKADLQRFQGRKSLRLRTCSEEPSKLDLIDVNWDKGKDSRRHDLVTRRHLVNVQSVSGITANQRNQIFKKLHSNNYLEVLRIKKLRRTFEVIPARFVKTSQHQTTALSCLNEGSKDGNFFRCVDNGLTVLVDTILECSHGDFSNIVEIEFDIKHHRQKAADISKVLLKKFESFMTPKKHNKIEYALAEGQGHTSRIQSLQFYSERNRMTANSQKAKSFTSTAPPTNETYLPGECFTIKGKWRRRAQPTSKKVLGHIPGRLHFFAWDTAKFSRAKPGGGGLGVSTSAAGNDIEITLGKNDVNCQPSVMHLKKLFCKLVDYNESQISIVVRRNITEVHSGLGSHVSLNTGIMAGLNVLFGSPFSTEELYDVLVHNYVENADSRSLVRGVDTGVGESSLLYGGIVWVDEQARYIGSVATPSLYGVIALGIREKLLTKRNAGRLPDDASRLLLRSFARHKLKHPFSDGKLVLLLSRAWDLNPLAFRLEKSFYNLDIYSQFSEIVRENGGSYAGISSEGPVMFALANNRKRAEAIAKNIEAKLSNYFSSCRVGAAGNRLSITVQS